MTSFGHVNFTWEEKDGELNFQDRFSRDYIRAESSGRQSGSFPLVMLRITGSNTETHDWLRRTAAGVALTHELRICEESKPYVEHFKRRIEFGYGLPEVRVSQYWKQDHPVSVSGIDAATLVCGNPGAALVVICDYGDGGEAALRLDRAALGLHGALRAIDTESGETLAQENGAFPVILKIMVS